MAVVARIVGYALLTAGFGVSVAYVLNGIVSGNSRDFVGVALLFGCIGTIVGAVAGAAGEIVSAQPRLTGSEAMKPMSKRVDFDD